MASDPSSASAQAADLGRRERRKLELRQRILEIAREQFAERGVEATRVQDLCAAVDIAEKTFFNYFPSKRHLLREVAHESLAELLLELETVRKLRVASAERIRLFFDKVAADAETAGPMQRELLTEMVHVAHETGAEHEQAQQLRAAFGALVAEGVAAGDLAETHSAETLTMMLMGAFYALMFNWANLDDFPIREQARATARFLAESMAR